jgi:hypothetical protein
MDGRRSVTGGLRGWLRRQADEYRKGEDRPLGGYVALMAMYGAGTAVASGVARARGRNAPRGMTPWEVTQLALATHKLSRLIAKDPVTSPLRAPFTTYSGTSAPGELDEEVRGQGLQHSVGELLTCPMCLAQWVASAFSLGMVFAPTTTRMVLATFSGIAGADFLQHAYVRLQQATESE